MGVLACALIAALVGASVLASPREAAAELPQGTAFYRSPDTQVARWVAQNPDDARAPLIRDVIDARPQGIWFAAYASTPPTSDVREITDAAAAQGRAPILVVYQMVNRDCGGASSGGAPSHAAYDAWIDGFAAGLGDDPVLVILEPDSLSLITCLNAQQRADRYASLSRAGSVIHAANPEARVYFDAGHSNWNSPATQADRLRSAGVTSNGDGVFSNVSNFRTTADEVAYTRAVLGQLGTPGLGAVIDTSRNGQGPAPDDEWCDPPGRGVGRAPTSDTGDERIDAFLWVKPPGEADGCGGPAGQFSPAVAHALAQNAGDGGGASDGGASDGGTSDGGTSDGGASTGGGGGEGCAASYRVASSWNNGFTGEVTIACDGGSLDGWTVGWDFPAGQRITQAWNATCSQSGAAVTCVPVSWNGAVPDGGSVTFGFNASHSGSNPAPAVVELT
ncbi:glycoside hydrolase family 6 protein [Streptomyces radicis]|uniref:glycoside hydrolase family 6 protein n=1 Tax=Streptomyces radicis TaxID=1750517 RepID=UPI001E5F92CC|nr:glycoside hydrolase family 6 protein [Streptomyces radicis]